jgi:wyosine [tRNA(Phe)-imidazoG37] synthetase (radical SAM superfamily)
MTTVPYHAIVYGPVRSRRFGTSLGVNPVPTPRVECAPGCVFCATGVADTAPIISRPGQIPSSGVVVTTCARRLIELSKAGEKLDSVTLAGNLDPTMHPGLVEIAENLAELRDKWYSRADLCLISDSTGYARADLRHVVSVFDRAIFTFEWGSAKTYDALRPDAEITFKAIVERLSAPEKGSWVAQATFVQGSVDNSSDREVALWSRKLDELRPKEVHLLTLEAGRERKVPGTKPVPLSRLEEIAAKVTQDLGIPATVVAREAQPV